MGALRQNLTDRAFRYRAQNNVTGPKRCVFCGSKKDLGVMHLDGNESHGEVANLAYGCRSCNGILAHAFKSIGAGRPTNQYNPSQGVPTFQQYMWAVSNHEREAHDEGGAIIHATPKHKRIEYARRIASKARQTKRERASERWNPMSKKKPNMWPFSDKRTSPRMTTPARGGIAARMPKPAKSKAATVGSYKGYRIWMDEDGGYRSSLDSDSQFETQRQVKSFIDSWQKGRGNPAPYFVDGMKFPSLGKARDFAKRESRNGSTEAVIDPTGKVVAMYQAGLAILNPAKFDRCVKEVKAKGGAANAYAVCTAAGTRKKGNPAGAAVEVYEEFHGRRPDEVLEVKRQVHFHEHLAGIGLLKRLVVKGVDGAIHQIRGFKGALLATNEDRSQLFIEGGDQALNLADFGIKKPHEVEKIGKVLTVDYFTRKDHLGDEGGEAVYTHDFRSTNQNGRHVTVPEARYPDLIYRVRDEQLEFSGGSYEIRAEGIDK